MSNHICTVRFILLIISNIKINDLIRSLVKLKQTFLFDILVVKNKAVQHHGLHSFKIQYFILLVPV